MEKVQLSEQISNFKSLDELRNARFTIVYFEYTLIDRGFYYPCEVGAIQFSLAHGIHDAYHTFISPKPLPAGTWAEAKHHAEETHQIPIMGDFPYWNTDVEDIANRLSSMIGSAFRVFSKNCDNEMKITVGCLNYLSHRTGSTIRNVSVIPIEHLVDCISRRFNVQPLLIDEISKYLQRPNHDFDPNIRCFYHEHELDSHFCAYASVFRLFFNVVDYMNENGIMRVNPSLLKVPDPFISRYAMVGKVFQYGMGIEKAGLGKDCSGDSGWEQNRSVATLDAGKTIGPSSASVVNKHCGDPADMQWGMGRNCDEDWCKDTIVESSSDVSAFSNRAYHGYGSNASTGNSNESSALSSNGGNFIEPTRQLVEVLNVQEEPSKLPKTLFGIAVEPQ